MKRSRFTEEQAIGIDADMMAFHAARYFLSDIRGR